MNEQTIHRSNQLTELGLKFNGEEFVDGDFNVHWTEVSCDTDEQFANKIEVIKKEKERRTEVTQ